MAEEQVTPASIMQLGLGFWGSKVLLTAVELGLFTELAHGALDENAIRHKLKLHARASRDFLDALVALGMLRRTEGLYANTEATDLFLDRSKPSYVGGILEMCNSRLYGFWGALGDALRSGKPQNEAKAGGNAFDSLYAEPERLKTFLSAMTGISMGAARAIAAKFPWSQYKTFADVGCAQGGTPVQIALAHPHLHGIGYDLASVKPVFETYVKSFSLSDRLTFTPGDFFREELPKVDVLTMGHILHDWGLEDKQMLLKKAYDALPAGGALIVFEAIIDDDRSKNAFGLLMSLNMLIETEAGFDYTGADCCAWMKKAGFKQTRVEHLAGPDSMVVGIK
jgi:hypothetical protein